MGDFAAPAAAANGSSICINSSLNSSLGGAGIGVNNTPNSTPAAPCSTHPAAGCGTGGRSATLSWSLAKMSPKRCDFR